MNDTQNRTSQTSRRAAVWRVMALLAWLVMALSFIAFFLIDLQLDYNQIQVACSGADCNWLALSPAEEAVLKDRGLSTLLYAQGMVIFTLIIVLIYWFLGSLILIRQYRTLFGWAVSLVLFVLPINTIADVDNVVNHYPDLALPMIVLSILGTLIFAAFFLLFPNGKFVPRWSVVFLIAFVLVEPILNLVYGDIIGPEAVSASMMPVLILFFIFQIFAFLGFQTYRYFWVSTASERLQTKWVLFGFIVLFLGFPVWAAVYGGMITIPAGEMRLLATVGGWVLLMLMMITLPVTIVIAITRYQLWNIDRIIRGSLIYALLSGIILILFFGSVIILQSLFGTLFDGGQSQLIIVASTLLVAALLNPLRRRVQSLVDRRFYRRKYNAQQALARFSATLSSEVEDREGIQRLLLRVMDETIQPSSATLWLRDRS